jgi:hypothetical protein
MRPHSALFGTRTPALESSPAYEETNHAPVHLSSLVKEFATDLMKGAAKSTIGTMVTQAVSQEVNQSLINQASVATRKNAIAEAIADVIPDWITAKRKCA